MAGNIANTIVPALCLSLALTNPGRTADRTGVGTLEAVFDQTNVEIDFSFDFESLPDHLKQQVKQGDGSKVAQRFQNVTGMFSFPPRGICHIEDVSVKSDPVYRRAPVEGKPPIDYSGARIHVSYTYCCDAASRRNPIDEFQTNAFTYLEGLAHIDTTAKADRGRRVSRERMTPIDSVVRLPPPPEDQPSSPSPSSEQPSRPSD
jgi:hypothetical protein